MRGEELPVLYLLLCLGVFMERREILRLQAVDSSVTGVAVIDAFARNDIFAGIDAEKDLPVDFLSHLWRDVLRDDLIAWHICYENKREYSRL